MALNDVRATRRITDLSRLRELEATMPMALKILSVIGNPPQTIKLQIKIPTAKDQRFPTIKQNQSEVRIILPESYPLPPGPTVTFSTPIYNPNVYESGMWCFGDWSPTENLALFVKRLMKVIALDPEIVNIASPANRAAATWYEQQRAVNPAQFPTIVLSNLIAEGPKKPKITWRAIN